MFPKAIVIEKLAEYGYQGYAAHKLADKILKWHKRHASEYKRWSVGDVVWTFLNSNV